MQPVKYRLVLKLIVSLSLIDDILRFLFPVFLPLDSYILCRWKNSFEIVCVSLTILLQINLKN